jgi:DNA repair photolyase
MPLSKSRGQMYDWCTHTHSHLGGGCPHKCSYCYVQAMAKRFGHDRYTGELRLVEKELDVNYGNGRTIFVEHCNDLFAEDVPAEWIERIIAHVWEYPDNTYVFQTKNPFRMLEYANSMPENCIYGATVETDKYVNIHAPEPGARIEAMKALKESGETTFITIEPILKCNPRSLAVWVAVAKPDFVNIGADSKGTGLDEPSGVEIERLIHDLTSYGVEIRQKKNLARLMGGAA